MKNVALMAGFEYDLMMLRDSGLLFGPPCMCIIEKTEVYSIFYSKIAE